MFGSTVVVHVSEWNLTSTESSRSTVVEVVVHGGGGSGTRFRRCSGSSVEVLDVHGVFEVDGSGTHVVVEVVVHVLKRNLTNPISPTVESSGTCRNPREGCWFEQRS